MTGPTVIENIWAGWRSEYLADPERRSPDPSGRSVFRRIIESGENDESTHIVHRSSTCFVILNRFPYAAGHLLVVPYRQEPDLVSLTSDESVDLWTTATLSVRALEAEYRPAGFNIGVNLGAAAGGSVRDHVHIHVVPRWIGDANFLVATANTKAIPEPLDITARRLTAAFRRLT